MCLYHESIQWRQRGWALCFVISKWHSLVNSEVLNLNYVIILGIFSFTFPQPKYWWGCVPGIPGGVDASAACDVIVYHTPPCTVALLSASDGRFGKKE